MKIAFLHFAEPYHCYHAEPMAVAMNNIPGCKVVEFVNYDECYSHLDYIREKLGAPKPKQGEFKKSILTRGLEKLRLLDNQRIRLLKENVEILNQFDAVVATEYTAGVLKDVGLTAKLVFLSHGSGDRKVGDEHLLSAFDLAILSGTKLTNYVSRQGYLRPEQMVVTGAPKLDLMSDAAKVTPPFSKPYVLYAPHYRNAKNHWKKALPIVAKGFREQSDFGLMIAPHVKMFHEIGGASIAKKLRQLECENIKVDTGSKMTQDLTYTSTASIYLGDISSQIYEFLARPRPCVFLNPTKIDWQNNPYYRHWTLGDVVDDPADVMEAIKNAPERHKLYIEAQKKLIEETYTFPKEGAGKASALALYNWLKSTR